MKVTVIPWLGELAFELHDLKTTFLLLRVETIFKIEDFISKTLKLP